MAEAETARANVLEGVRVGDEIDDDGRGVRAAQGEFAGEPVPGQRRVAQRRRGGAGQGQVEEALALVYVELARDVEVERAGLRGDGAQTRQDGLRVERVREFDDRRRRRAGEHARRHRRERRQHGGRVDEAPLAGGSGREQQRRAGLGGLCLVVALRIDHHSRTVTATQSVALPSRNLKWPRGGRFSALFTRRVRTP
ncbi:MULTISPECIES: hypothetical protein [unclassified Streptomyces]|uniref:hypothetical protein n=1 Tax=unclassified Streptomyces TaxID=2593676 RepID=UPI00278BC738|nr:MULTISPECIES: hypothetical protein [unclassified Streptomyces]